MRSFTCAVTAALCLFATPQCAKAFYSAAGFLSRTTAVIAAGAIPRSNSKILQNPASAVAARRDARVSTGGFDAKPGADGKVLSATALSATVSPSVVVSLQGKEMPAREEKSKIFKAYEKGSEYFTNLFPVWLTVFSLVALKDPSIFAWFTTE